MPLINDKANELAGQLKVDKVVAFDPATILLIMQIIAGVIQMLYYCHNSDKSAVAFAKRPGIWGRWRLSRYLRKNLKGHPMLKDHIPQLESSIESMGATLTEDEIGKLRLQSIVYEATGDFDANAE